MKEQLKEAIEGALREPLKDFEKIASMFELVSVGRKELLVSPQTSADYLYFVTKGCLRSYVVDHKKKEHTIQFAIENWWLQGLSNPLEKTSFYIQSIESSELLMIRLQDFYRLLKEDHQMAYYFAMAGNRVINSLYDRVLSIHSLTSDEKYERFIKRFPEIEQRVPQYMVASYLGFSQEVVSRIRRNLVLTDS